MSTRHIARTVALQTLFELDMRDVLDSSQVPENIDAIIIRNTAEFGEGIKDTSFTKSLVSSVLSRKITLDDIIVRAAPDWPIEKIGVVDRNVLRIGLAELLFGDRSQVPPKVAIDEAIELAKTYAGDTSGKFVNGVLGAIYKEMGEPEKAQTTKSRKEHFEHGKRELLVGAIILAKRGNSVDIALVHDVFGYWTLPKGHVQGSANIEEEVAREVKKEVGISVEVLEKIGENEYIANKPDQGKVVKHVMYYVTKSNHDELALEQKGGLDEAKWFPFTQIETLRIYDDILPLLRKGKEVFDQVS